MSELTPNQLKFLAECEEEFKNRYTEADSNFAEFIKIDPIPPPVISPWFQKPKRDFFFHNRGFGGEHRDNFDRRYRDGNGGGYKRTHDGEHGYGRQRGHNSGSGSSNGNYYRERNR